MLKNSQKIRHSVETSSIKCSGSRSSHSGQALFHWTRPSDQLACRFPTQASLATTFSGQIQSHIDYPVLLAWRSSVRLPHRTTSLFLDRNRFNHCHLHDVLPRLSLCPLLEITRSYHLLFSQ